MADLILKRAMGRRDLLRRYVVAIDGERIGHIRAGATTHFKIAEGMRRVSVSIDGYSAPERILLASDKAIAILRCAPGPFLPPPPKSPARSFSFTDYLPLDQATYISLEVDRAEEVARAFVQAAWSVAQFQIQERTRPGTPSRYGLTAGDMSVLYHGCRTPDANMITAPGSANHRLWTELARIGWLANGSVPDAISEHGMAFQMTGQGRVELLEIFGNIPNSKLVVPTRTVGKAIRTAQAAAPSANRNIGTSAPPEILEAMRQCLYNWKYLSPEDVESLRRALSAHPAIFDVAATPKADRFWTQLVTLDWVTCECGAGENRQRYAWTDEGRKEFPNLAQRYAMFQSAAHNHRLAKRLNVEAPILAALVERYETLSGKRAVRDPKTGVIVRVRSTPEIETRSVDVEGLLPQTVSWSLTIHPAHHKPEKAVSSQTIEILSGTIDFMFKRLVARGMLIEDEIHDHWELMLAGFIAFNIRWPLQNPPVIFSDYWLSRANGARYPFSMPNHQEFEALCLPGIGPDTNGSL